MLSVAVKVFFLQAFSKVFLIHTGKAGGFIDLKVYKKGCRKTSLFAAAQIAKLFFTAERHRYRFQ
jgi:hypothetical protein